MVELLSLNGEVVVSEDVQKIVYHTHYISLATGSVEENLVSASKNEDVNFWLQYTRGKY